MRALYLRAPDRSSGETNDQQRIRVDYIVSSKCLPVCEHGSLGRTGKQVVGYAEYCITPHLMSILVPKLLARWHTQTLKSITSTTKSSASNLQSGRTGSNEGFRRMYNRDAPVSRGASKS